MSQFTEVISDARCGDAVAIGALLEPYRNYLRFLANAQLGRQLSVRASPSDIVQDTMLAAHRDLHAFQGSSSTEFIHWLRSILARCLLKSIEHNVKAQKRAVNREISIDQMRSAVDSSCTYVSSFLVSEQPTPSQIVSREEDAILIANLISELPEDYQRVIALRNFGELRFEEVALKMQRSPQAVRMLWLRAIHRLRELMPIEHRS